MIKLAIIPVCFNIELDVILNEGEFYSLRAKDQVPDLEYVVVNFLFQLIFIFPLFWGMVMYANEFKTKEKQKLTEIKN